MTNLRFEDVPIVENFDPMVNLADYPFILAPMYHEWGLSDTPELWVRKAIADKLLCIQKEKLGGKKFKIWDPWRSREVQNNIYRKFRDELAHDHPEWDEEKLAWETGVFVTKPDDPERIPPHATGGSIDLTVVDEEGVEIDFGTAFDHFGPEAATNFYGIDTKIGQNRRWLHDLMKEEGFESDTDEWWHFDLYNQKWALQRGARQSFYGEIIDPREFNRHVKPEKSPAVG